MDRSFCAIFLAIAIIGAITWLAILEHNHHPRIYRYNEEVTILQVGESDLDFNHPRDVHHLVAEWGEECEVVAEVADTVPHEASPTG